MLSTPISITQDPIGAFLGKVTTKLTAGGLPAALASIVLGSSEDGIPPLWCVCQL